jgi:hypothetical protein
MKNLEKNKMSKSLEKISRELNPIHDFDNIRFYNHVNVTSPQEKLRAQIKNLRFFLTLIKPIARGGIIGGMLGAAVNYFRGDSLLNGLDTGAWLGLTIDYSQYALRGLFRYIKAQI